MITITESADKHLSTIIRDNNAQGVMLGVKGGGCAGFTYEWSVLEEIPDRFNQEDKLALKHGQLCIQPKAIMFILNTVIDFTSNVAGSYLKIVNPNATSQCGCGESFSL